MCAVLSPYNRLSLFTLTRRDITSTACIIAYHIYMIEIEIERLRERMLHGGAKIWILSSSGEDYFTNERSE